MRNQYDNNSNDSWLIETNQMWKVWVFSVLMILAIVFFMCMIMSVNGILIPDRKGELEFSLASIILAFGSLIWFNKSLKCPHCGYKPTWPILKSAPASEWFVRITNLKHCPSCKK